MYSLSLFLHIVGALGIFAALAVEQAALVNLRRASTNAQAREWLSPLRSWQRIQGPSGLLLIVTGFYMMATGWRHQAWPGMGLLGMVLMVIVGAVVTGRRMKAIGRGLPAGDGPLPTAIRERLADPALRTSALVRLGLALGVVFDMSVKPGTTGALAAVVVAGLLGFGAAQWRRGGSRPVGRAAVQE